MAPALAPGDRLLVLPLPRSAPRAVRATLREGAVVVVAAPSGSHEHLDVKRVRRIGPDGVWVEGDHPTRSTDSRSYGTLPLDRVRAVAVARWPALWRRP